MSAFVDGPASPLFKPVVLRGNVSLAGLARAGASAGMSAAAAAAPTGACVCHGIPFKIGRAVWAKDKPVAVRLQPLRAEWLVFQHTADASPLDVAKDGFIRPMPGQGRLGELAATYVVCYADGTEESLAIQRRHQIGMFTQRWGEGCFQAVPHGKPAPVPANHEQPTAQWGRSQTRVRKRHPSLDTWVNWLWAWANPHPRKRIVGLRIEPGEAAVLLSGLAVGKSSSLPLRWNSRRKALLTLPRGQSLEATLDEHGRLKQIQLDLGQVISARPRLIYPNDRWSRSYNNQLPEASERQVIVEYTAHDDARFHLAGGKQVPAARLAEPASKAGPMEAIAPASQRVTIRVIERGSRKAVPVKLHVHGQAGEYLAPVDRHRLPNPSWFEDYATEFSHRRLHHCTYIPGEVDIDLPLGPVYVELSKGFEIRPVRKVVRVTAATRQITFELDKVLPWRDKGWVTADTHVHFLSPQTALLEGSAEGVNVVNLLASQWGELMTNVGDFDGRTTHGARQFGGDGEYLVRVGTENRQSILGHISLLGYRGRIIAPMTTGGPDEAAVGDPVEVLLADWARQCRRQGGLVVMPHFPNPRCEISGLLNDDIDAIEMTSWGHLYGGIDPYSLSDWYRYLNCGYLVPAVAGTDKMEATTAVGTIRTYAFLGPDRPFTYQAWMDAVRAGRTFVTYGPLMEFAVEGLPAGQTVQMTATGGTVQVAWRAASVTVPMSRVELVVNGEVVRGERVGPDRAEGGWSVKLTRSSWLAVLIRGHYRDKSEIIAAHSSPVVVRVGETPIFAAADAATILDQIEGSLAYLDTVGTRAQTARYKQMRRRLTAAHRKLHNRMHRMGCYHKHVPTEDHAEHRHPAGRPGSP